MSDEIPKVFRCGSARLLGILHTVDAPADVGVVVVVGGPQYRVGSHRQFVLMARRVAAAGIPVLRFDYRGMGDAEGEMRTFVDVDEDIRAAVDCLIAEVPSVEQVTLLGLCDAASANLMYSLSDDRITGLILLNPWVRTTAGQARTYLRHYYLRRFLQKSFWRKVFSGKWRVAESISGFGDSVRDATKAPGDNSADAASEKYLERMLRGLTRFQGGILILISGRDLTAQEFVDLCEYDRHWKKAIARPAVAFEHFPEADHTMSAKRELIAASDACISWLQSRADDN